MPNVITLHMGQCGVQVGSALWELLCLEHGIGPDGEVVTEVDNSQIGAFFQEANENKYSPRSLFVDTDLSTINEIRTSCYRNLYHPDYLLSGAEDAANNFARGSFFVGTELLKPFRNRLNKVFEQMDSVESLIIFNSLGGGTGSGTGALFLQQVMLDFPKLVRIQFPLLPGPQTSTAVVEPYNMVFHYHTTMDTIDLCVQFDNESLYNMCNKLLFISRPTYSSINRLMALMISCITCSMRFESYLQTSMQEIHTNLIPYPRIHFPLVRHAPVENEARCIYAHPTVDDITKAVFRQENQTVKCDASRGKYISVIMNYRGKISPREMTEAIQKRKPQLCFVEWSPTGFKMGLNNQSVIVVPASEIAVTDKAVTMIANTTAIRETIVHISRKFDLLFEKKAFIHWFINEGMEETEFGESRYDMQLLQEDYEEISFTEEEIIQALQDNPERKDKSISIRYNQTSMVQGTTDPNEGFDDGQDLEESTLQNDYGEEMPDYGVIPTDENEDYTGLSSHGKKDKRNNTSDHYQDDYYRDDYYRDDRYRDDHYRDDRDEGSMFDYRQEDEDSEEKRNKAKKHKKGGRNKKVPKRGKMRVKRK